MNCTCGHPIDMHTYMGCMEHIGDGVQDTDYCACMLKPDAAIQASELAQLRADLDAAQREREEALARVAELQASRAELMATLAAYGEVEQPNGEPLTTRRCVTCAQEAAREMRDAVVNRCKDLANRTDIYREAIDTKRNRAIRGEHIIYENLAAYFNSMPLPSCDGCNPLKPEAENEATR